MPCSLAGWLGLSFSSHRPGAMIQKAAAAAQVGDRRLHPSTDYRCGAVIFRKTGEAEPVPVAFQTRPRIPKIKKETLCAHDECNLSVPGQVKGELVPSFHSGAKTYQLCRINIQH